MLRAVLLSLLLGTSSSPDTDSLGRSLARALSGERRTVSWEPASCSFMERWSRSSDDVRVTRLVASRLRFDARRAGEQLALDFGCRGDAPACIVSWQEDGRGRRTAPPSAQRRWRRHVPAAGRSPMALEKQLRRLGARCRSGSDGNRARTDLQGRTCELSGGAGAGGRACW